MTDKVVHCRNCNRVRSTVSGLCDDCTLKIHGKLFPDMELLDIKVAVYKSYSDGRITKDGHTMFPKDIASDLNRKSYLEEQQYIQDQRQNKCKHELTREIDDPYAGGFRGGTYTEKNDFCPKCGKDLRR